MHARRDPDVERVWRLITRAARGDAPDGWADAVGADDPHRALVDLYLPICNATLARPITVAHLGQSLDGFIATHAGESRWVTGPENLQHMHRMRALCDAVLVGAGTVAADDPQLTTRLVEGPSPVRVVLDPTRGLEPRYRLFTEGPETLYVCARSLVTPGERRFGCATVVGVDQASDGGVDLQAVMHLLHERGCARVFIEGGGVTVSAFLAANLLDRLHVALAPLLIGDGRPAIRLPPRAALDDCHRPRYRVFRMGGDILFDCDLRGEDAGDSGRADGEAIARVI
jgi:diaminohydroxyphosphoribosylaminopyrimidine deaminase/5-amino-6-(5-phosphoribosylamino)uracil reductase